MANNQEGFNKEKFVGKVDGKLQDKYEIIKEIGEGGFSRCYLVKNKTTGLNYACKELAKKKVIQILLNYTKYMKMKKVFI